MRYRYDLDRKRRFKTVEIIVDEADWEPSQRTVPRERDIERIPKIVGLRIGFAEKDLQETVKKAGGRWDAGMRLWLVPVSIAKLLGLEDRIVQVIPIAQRESPETEPARRGPSVYR